MNPHLPLLIELHYLPCIHYFALLGQHNEVYLEAREHFVKQTYRSRAYILTANKIDMLTLPIVHKGGQKQLITEVEIDYRERWQQRHWRAIHSAYAKAPFFEYYGYFFEEIIFSGEPRLFELNLKLLSCCLKLLGTSVQLRQTDSYMPQPVSGFADKRGYVAPENEIGTINVPPYHQLFGHIFVENLSILDLLFNCGPESRQIIANTKFLAPK